MNTPLHFLVSPTDTGYNVMDEQNGWLSQYANARSDSEGQHNDFFAVVPPTPFDFTHGPFDQSRHDHVADTIQHGHHLRPFAFRAHRSASSSGSISSQISAFSSNTSYTQWGSESDSHSDFAQSSFPGFAVDPKVFQAQVKEVTIEQECLTAKPVIQEDPPPQSKKRARATNQQDKDEKKKISHARKAQQHPEHIPRPRNAFILFRKHVVDSKLIPTSVEIRHQNVSIITAKMWAEASAEQKAQFNELAKIEKEEHLKKYPGYRYQPVYRRTNVVRRRVRKDAAEEEKCKSVAQLLMQGKSGEELAEEIKENGTKISGKGSRAPSKKGQANELSKGALRALRAQARQGGSGEGSDMSRSVSRAASSDAVLDDDLEEFDSPAPLFMHLGEPTLIPDQAYSQPTISWGYQQPAAPGPSYGQNYASPDHRQALGLDPQPIHTNLYPVDIDGNGLQHQSMNYDLPAEFYTHDQALPFSPSVIGFSQVHAHAQPGTSAYRGMRDGVADMSFPLFAEGLQSPTVSMGQQAHFHDLTGSSHPVSARWDRGFESWGVGGDGTLEGLGFSEQDMMLNDYGSALAQAGDMGVW